MKENIMANVNEASTIFLASSLFLPSITAISSFALLTSISIKTIDVKIPNSANCAGEKYLGNNKENTKLMICTNTNPKKSVEKFLKKDIFLLVKVINAKLLLYSNTEKVDSFQ
jgi:hypothetical protein